MNHKVQIGAIWGKVGSGSTAEPATLTFGTDALDISAFTRLGEVFASVMTGNLVLLGLATGTVLAMSDRA